MFKNIESTAFGTSLSFASVRKPTAAPATLSAATIGKFTGSSDQKDQTPAAETTSSSSLSFGFSHHPNPFIHARVSAFKELGLDEAEYNSSFQFARFIPFNEEHSDTAHQDTTEHADKDDVEDLPMQDAKTMIESEVGYSADLPHLQGDPLAMDSESTSTLVAQRKTDTSKSKLEKNNCNSSDLLLIPPERKSKANNSRSIAHKKERSPMPEVTRQVQQQRPDQQNSQRARRDRHRKEQEAQDVRSLMVPEGFVLVLDTCTLLDFTDALLEKLASKNLLIIPRVVIGELDYQAKGQKIPGNNNNSSSSTNPLLPQCAPISISTTSQQGTATTGGTSQEVSSTSAFTTDRSSNALNRRVDDELQRVNVRSFRARSVVDWLLKQCKLYSSESPPSGVRLQSASELDCVFSRSMRNNDDKILCCALYFRREYKGRLPVVLVTKDCNLQNKSRVETVQCCFPRDLCRTKPVTQVAAPQQQDVPPPH